MPDEDIENSGEIFSENRFADTDDCKILIEANTRLQNAILNKLESENLSVSDIKSLTSSLKDAIAISRQLQESDSEKTVNFIISSEDLDEFE